MGKLISSLKSEPVIFLAIRMWRFASTRRKAIVGFFLLFLAANLISLIGPLIFAELLNTIQAEGVTEASLPRLLIILSFFVGVTILFWLFHGTGRVIERNTAFHIRTTYREHLMRGVLHLDLAWHGEHDSGDTIDKVNKASNALYEFSQTTFVIIQIVVRIVGTSVVLYFFNPYIGLAVIPFIAGSFFMLFLFDKQLVKQYKNLNLLENRVSAKVFDALSNVTSVVILNVATPIIRNLKRVMLHPFPLYKKNAVLNELKWFSGSVSFDLLIVLPLAFYILYAFQNNLVVEIGTISALYLYLTRLSEVFFTFSRYYEDIIVHKTEVQNAAGIEAEFTEHARHQEAAPAWNTLTLHNTQFAYTDMEHGARQLDDISLSITRGERIAMVGESGSGKTTFLKVLHGLYPTAHAHVAFDGDEARQTSFADLDLRTMLVPQEPELFSASIRENITFGVAYSKGDIEMAVQLAQFSDVVEQLPRGMKSLINEKGVNLSGGQKQRLALARALLFAKDKDIILLDESTSSVDPKNETTIYENIFAAFPNITIIASIHKMNLLKYFDRIVMFADGKVVDEGTFDDLCARNENFRTQWEHYVRAHAE